MRAPSSPGSAMSRSIEVAGAVLLEHGPAAISAGIRLTLVESRIMARGDARLLQRALGNLVGNAIRHAQGTRILVGARLRGGQVELWVIDDGRGIVAGDVERLFEDFAQGSDHGLEDRGGFGLGLSSARRLIDLQQGRPELRSGAGGAVPPSGSACPSATASRRRRRRYRSPHAKLPDLRRPSAGARGAGRRGRASLARRDDRSGRQFPEAWDKAAAAPDLCLADLTMPGAEERAGIAELRRVAPATPVLVITGSHDDRLLLGLIG